MPKTFAEIVNAADTIYVDNIEVENVFFMDGKYHLLMADETRLEIIDTSMPVDITKTVNGMQPVFRFECGSERIVTATVEQYLNIT